MFKKGDYVVYKRDVVEIVGMKINGLNHQEYYVLVPVDDKSSVATSLPSLVK